MAKLPEATNAPVLDHGPGSPERAVLEEALGRATAERVDVPIRIGSEAIRTGREIPVVMPHRHGHVLAMGYEASGDDVRRAIDVAMSVAPAWGRTSREARSAIFLKAADLLTGPWRARVNAACMLSQSKTVYQSEIDAICELADFWRFNARYLEELETWQPISPAGQWNRLELRPLEGFVFAVTPFNFLSIAANLPTAPIMAGNVALWKPASPTLLGAQVLFDLLREAGLPDGVLSLLPGAGPEQGEAALESEHLAGIHFTGSTATFRALWRGVGERLDRYRAFPRVVGETGGKDFVVAHPSADAHALATAIVRGGFEYQGQKCSAASRVYVPRSLWPEVRDRVVADLETITYGDVTDYRHFGGAVIDARAFEKHAGYQELAAAEAKIIAGGGNDDSVGYFIEPTFVEVRDPKHRLMSEEIFGPIVSAFVYEDSAWSETLDLVDSTSPYGLTGAVFARERAAVDEAKERLKHAAGNFYINDKPTGAVVCQQPFGGGRQSGTNDKAGAPYNLLRWLSPRSVKETFVPAKDYRYPYMG